MNRPTALFFAAVHYLYGGDEDAVGVAYDLVRSSGFTGFGRDRHWAALEKVAPTLAEALRDVGCDIIYVEADAPRACYRAVAREISRAEAWLSENGVVPAICLALHTASVKEWPGGWKGAVWAAVNFVHADEADRLGVPLPRDTREALAAL